MGQKKKLLWLLTIIGMLILTQVTPVFAEGDGLLFKTYVNVNVRTDHSTSAGIIMTTATGEALAEPNSNNTYDDGTYYWRNYKGWKYSTGSPIVGWAVNAKDNTYPVQWYTHYVQNPEAKPDLNTYSSSDPSNETNTYIAGNDIPANSTLNPRGMYCWIYSDMYYLKVTDYVTSSGGQVTFPNPVWVHTNFRTTSPSNYYLVF